LSHPSVSSVSTPAWERTIETLDAEVREPRSLAMN
jgi:hypothetical protein